VHEPDEGPDRWSVRGGDPAEESIFSHDPPAQGSRSRTVLLIAAAAVCALLTSASILHTAMLLFVRSVGEKKVPDLVGLEISAARVELERAGYTMAIEREVYTPNYGEGRVVSQRPGPGQALRRGRKIHLTLSMGMKESQLPQVTGLSLRQAALELQKAGFAEGGILRVDHPKVEKGSVIAQDPPAGALGSEGAPVNLLVSTGSAMKPKRIPDIVGLSIREANEILRAAGFIVDEKRTRTENDLPEGTVLDQFPAPGSQLLEGGEVNLTLSSRERG